MPSCEMFNISSCMICLLGCSTFYPGKIVIFQEIGLYLLTPSVAENYFVLRTGRFILAFFFFLFYKFVSSAAY